MYFTSEQVSAGHPDKIADQISDAIVTDCLQHDRNSRVAVECMIKDNHVTICGEITSKHNPNFEELVNRVVLLPGVEVTTHISQQSPDIARGVDNLGAGDQGIMYGYATDETQEMLPIPFVLATKALELLAGSDSPCLRPDAKSQVTFNYHAKEIETFLISTQHAADADLNEVRYIARNAMIEAAECYGMNTDFRVLVNPTGRFVIGGSYADTGVTGRKLICDTYGGMARHGGGAMCVDGDTEFLTPHGWKKISEYTDGDMVGQWNAGALEFVKPDAYIVNRAQNMTHITSEDVIDMVLSEKHDVVLETAKGNIIKKQVRYLFDENGVRNGNHGYIPTSFSYVDDSAGLALSDEQIQLQVAFCADGSLIPKKEKWSGRVRVKKQRKKERMRYLLDKTSTEYTESPDGDFTIFWFNPPFASKCMSECLASANSRQFRVIADECQLWDGEDRVFRTSIKAEADFIQFAFMTAYGTNASISADDRMGESYEKDGREYERKSICYMVYATKRTKFQIKHGKKGDGTCKCTPYEPENGLMYCFSVPSGMLVLRRNNKVFVTGNSGKDPTKVDRSGAYMARKIAKDIVRNEFAHRCEVQLAYAIGLPEPVSIVIDCRGTQRVSKGHLLKWIRKNYDLTPAGIIHSLGLLDVDYNEVSTLGHFWRGWLPWEK